MMLHPRLTLARPLSVFDCETTGRFPDRDRIIDIAIVTLFPDGETRAFSSLVDPGIPIPPSATAVHGITDAMVHAAPAFKQLAPKIRAELAGSDLCGYNAKRFDVVLLCAEFKRVGVTFSMDGRRVIDPYVIFAKRESRDLSAAVQFFCGKPLEDAHRAQADVYAAIDVLRGQLDRYPDLPATVEALHDYCKDPAWIDDTGRLIWVDGVACIGFGKYAGRSLRELTATAEGRDYLRWLCSADFPDDTKRIVTAAILGTFPVPPVTAEGGVHVNAV
jgi:DNA polymerase-3 subunit epsilon